MKVAIEIVGNIRSWNNCKKSFYQIFGNIGDIFVCTSKMQYELHPFWKEKLNFHYDTELSQQDIETFFPGAKEVLIIDDDNLNSIISRDYLPKFVEKGWTGIDIFKQYYKFKKCNELRKKYGKYDIVIKTRPDLLYRFNNIDFDKLSANEIWTAYGDDVNDYIFIGNEENIDKIPQMVENGFFQNITNDSIHSILKYGFSNFNILNNICLDAVLNREYINTQITCVTAFFDINRDNWPSYNRPMDTYFNNAKNVLNNPHPFVIFTEDKFVDQIKQIRPFDPKYTKIITMPLNALQFYDQKDAISKNMQNNINNIPQYDRNCPEFWNPLYLIVIFNKLLLLNQVSETNYFNSSYFQWVDFGTHSNICNKFKQFQVSSKFRIVGFSPKKLINNKVDFYNSHFHTLAATLFGGNKKYISNVTKLFLEEVYNMFSMKLNNQEQYILYYLICNNSSLFDYKLTNSWNNVGNSYYNYKKSVALCFSGNLRSFSQCLPNIKEKLVSRLSGYNVDIYLSTWDTNNWDNLDITKIDFFNYIDCEHYDQNNFIQYKSNQWLKNIGLSGPDTHLNAISMHYKLSKVFKMLQKEYDIIFRLRPDCIYNDYFNPIHLEECLINETIYLPEWHGKYEKVTMKLMDHYAFGPYHLMKEYFSVYDNIEKLLNIDGPHTSEGFLWEQIKNIKLTKLKMNYGLIRQNNEILYLKYID